VVEEKDKEREEQDELGPLRPLTPSKSAPVMAAVVRESVERCASLSGVSAMNVHKSASATPLSLLVQSSPPVRTDGRCHCNKWDYKIWQPLKTRSDYRRQPSLPVATAKIWYTLP